MATDEELVTSFLESGQDRFLEELTRRHLQSVWSLTYQMVVNASDADDLTQEVFLRVLRNLEQFGGRSRFSTWLYRITMNTAHTFLAKRRRDAVETPAHVETEDWRDGDPHLAAVRDEFELEVGKAVESLSPKLRAAVVLTTIRGNSPNEAAKIEGCASGTMYWRIHEARRQLKQQLREYLS